MILVAVTIATLGTIGCGNAEGSNCDYVYVTNQDGTYTYASPEYGSDTIRRFDYGDKIPVQEGFISGWYEYGHGSNTYINMYDVSEENPAE